MQFEKEKRKEEALKLLTQKATDVHLTYGQIADKTGFSKRQIIRWAEQLKEMDKSGELTSKSPLEVLDQLISFQRIEDQNNTTERYKKKAKLYSPLADLQDVLYIPARHLNAALIDQLATNQYIDNSRNVMITSATGCGKAFLACALGNNACEHQYTVRYFTMTELLEEFRIAEAREKYVKFLRQLANTYLIIIDDFLLTSVTDRDVEYLYRNCRQQAS